MTAKKIFRSSAAKLIAFLLIIGCAAASLLQVKDTVLELVDRPMRDGDSGVVYRFESDFLNSDWMGQKIGGMVSNLEYALFRGSDQQTFEQGYEARRFPGEYYACMGDTVLKNADLTEQDMENSYAFYSAMPSEGVFYNCRSYYYPQFDNRFYMDIETPAEETGSGEETEAADTLPENTVIRIRMTEEQVETYRTEWEMQRAAFTDAVRDTLMFFVLAVAAYIYLLFVTGRRAEDEEVHLVTIDRLYVEFNLIALVGGLVLAAAANLVVWDEALGYGSSDLRLFISPCLVLLLGALALAVELSLSLVRNLKNRTFVQRSFILRAVRWCWKTVKQVFFWLLGLLKRFWKLLGRGWRGIRGGCASLMNTVMRDYKTRKVVLLFAGFSAVLAFLSCMTGFMVFRSAACLLFLLLGWAWLAAACTFLLKRIKGFDCIVNGLKRLRAGELTYKVTEMPAGVFAAMADDLNSLGDGMQKALQNEIRAERMKSELITNVSHDLKTPLTSILNYADLLCQQHLTPEEANDYAKIIHQKGLRLKNLTSDLFDISKVQSGVEQINCERLDACTLMRQALAEQDAAIEAGKLTLKVDLPGHEVPIWADGKKMSRVMENLIGNCIKYSLSGTRVFLSVSEQEDGAVEIEIKNIANYAMDFDASKITERFVRGDSARSTEGSGLGLAIAKSYVSACGGTLSVDVDGDLFKVRMTFPPYDAVN